ncbi:MAG: NAD/NADP octopine/nopaline dehydrogenase family protein [Geminicoccaceae bacterium]|nr:NAD/NADP octopine/nopaline dehydrogenase family protein [Geminicoccaceae bacterium]
MSDGTHGLTVGVAGAGSIAFGTAALLAQYGHRPMLWSPSGSGTSGLMRGAPLVATGAIDGQFPIDVATDATGLAAASDVVILALPAYGHKTVMDALAPHLRDGQPVIISSHASFGALYLARLLAARGIRSSIVCWGTTAVTGRRQSPASVQVNTVRAQVDLCTLPQSGDNEALSLCNRLFGERFRQRDGLLAIALSNLNPQNHMGIALGNMTRMERGEAWSQGQNVTPNVGRLLEALDAERLAIAEALGLEVKTIFEHFHLSFHVPVASISQMNQDMHAQGNGGTGPATADSRYVTEDVPYGLVPTVILGELVGRPARLHSAGVEIFGAMYGRDFFAENDLIEALNLGNWTLPQLREAAAGGCPPVTP